MVLWRVPDLLVHGGVAQLGEHLLCKQGVVGSIPSASTRGSGIITGGYPIGFLGDLHEARTRRCGPMGLVSRCSLDK